MAETQGDKSILDSSFSVSLPQRLQLVVTYFNHQVMYYPVFYPNGWKIDTAGRQIIVGKGVPRTMIPLDSVANYTIEAVGGASD